MAQAPPLYDLMLLLDADAPSERRTEILENVQSTISGQGAIERNDDWGVRTLAYEIDHRTEAAYHLLQFTGPPALLESLQHNLKVTDGVIRHRIIRVRPGTPPPPPPPAARAERPAEAPPAAEPAAESAEAPAGAPAGSGEAPAPEPETPKAQASAEPEAAAAEAPAAPASEEPAPPAEAPAG